MILLKRRKAIPLIGSFVAFLIKLTGCGGGGASRPPATIQETFDFAVTINGNSRTITMPTRNPTVIALTRTFGAVELEGDRVLAIDGVRDSKSVGSKHWRYRDDNNLTQEPATSHRLASRQLTWHYEVTDE